MISDKRLGILGAIRGIDISSIQQNVDFVKAKQQGVEFVFIKLSDGTTGMDAYRYSFPIKERIQAALDAGLKIGYYHFCRPGNVKDPKQDAQEELSNLLKALEGLQKPHFPIALDIEEFSTQMVWAGDKKTNLELYDSYFIQGLLEAGYDVMIYSGLSFLNENIPLNSVITKYPLWVAEYMNPELNYVLTPIVYKTWDIWQYSGTGVVDFCGQQIDLNIMHKDFFEKY